MVGWDGRLGGGAGASFRLICLLFQRHANGSGLAAVAGGAPIRELVGNAGGGLLAILPLLIVAGEEAGF
jgi:hypothetical protein